MPDAPKRQDEPDPFTVEPIDFGLPIDDEKAAREIEMRAEIHGSSPKAWLASERHSELNVQRLYGCRHCGTFAYSPPIAHRVESMGLSCGEEEFVLRPHDLVEQVEAEQSSRINAVKNERQWMARARALAEQLGTEREKFAAARNALIFIADRYDEGDNVEADMARDALAVFAAGETSTPATEPE